MNFPKSIQLMGQTIRVITDPTLADKHAHRGYCDYGHQAIIIDTSQGPDFTAAVFFHEVVHYILFMMEEHKLRNNEKFVNMFANLLYQALKPQLMAETEVLVMDSEILNMIPVRSNADESRE